MAIMDSSTLASKALEAEKKIVLQKIGQMSNLPTPGANIMRVMLLLRDEDVSMRDLIESIGKDQSLVARILKLINSGYYGLRKTIDTVDRAINLLGILKVKQVVYSASIMDIFSKDEEKEWNHAYSSSVLISSIMEQQEIPAASNLPMTILMHDIGKVVLRRFMPKKYTMVTDSAEQEKLPQYMLEDRLIHLNHAEAGGWLLEKWQMTEDIYKPVLHHHSQVPPEEFVLETALLQFVNWVDCSARNILCKSPSSDLMKAAGIEEIDVDYWINHQRTLIDDIENKSKEENSSDTRKFKGERGSVAAGGGRTSTEKIDKGEIPSPENAEEKRTPTEKINRKEIFPRKEEAPKNDNTSSKKGILKKLFGG